MLKKLLALALLAVFAAVLGLWLAARSSREPLELGLVNNQLRPCPETPNCVSSVGASGEALVAPLATGAEIDRAFAAMLSILRGRADCEMVEVTENYAHATARTGWFGFVDDVELHLDVQAQLLHVRSASRVGHSDLGANAKRVAELRVALEERLSRGAQ